MKTGIRCIALALAAGLLLLSLLSCGRGTDPAKDSEPSAADSTVPSGEDELKPNLPDGLDFGGYEVRFIVSGGNTDETAPGENTIESRSISVSPEADMGYIVNKAVYDRNIKVEEQLHVKITQKLGVAIGDLGNILAPTLLSDLDEYDVVAAYQFFDLGIAFGKYAGKMLNYNRINEDEMYIDLSKPYWDKATFDTLGYGGASYWLTGDLSQAWVGSIYVSFVNTRLWNTYADTVAGFTGGEKDIYKVVENGDWTLDLWCSLGPVLYIDKNQNDTVDHDDQTVFVTHGNTMRNTDTVDGLTAGSHVTYTHWEDGVPSVDFYNDHNIAFAEKLYRLAAESKSYIYPIDGEEFYLTHFTEGNTLLCVAPLSVTEDWLCDMQDDYYILPPPKLDSSQDNYYSATSDNVSHYGIPASCPNVGAVTAAMELLGYTSWCDVTPAYYETALKTRYVRGDLNQQAEMIDFIHSRIYSDFVSLWAGSCDNITWFFRLNLTNKHFASGARTKEKSAQRKLEKLLLELDAASALEP